MVEWWAATTHFGVLCRLSVESCCFVAFHVVLSRCGAPIWSHVSATKWTPLCYTFFLMRRSFKPQPQVDGAKRPFYQQLSAPNHHHNRKYPNIAPTMLHDFPRVPQPSCDDFLKGTGDRKFDLFFRLCIVALLLTTALVVVNEVHVGRHGIPHPLHDRVENVVSRRLSRFGGGAGSGGPNP